MAAPIVAHPSASVAKEEALKSVSLPAPAPTPTPTPGSIRTPATRAEIEAYTRVYAKTGSFVRNDADELPPVEVLEAVSWLPHCPIVASLTRHSPEYGLVDPAFLTAYCLMRSAFKDPEEEFPIPADDRILAVLADTLYQGAVTYCVRGLDPIRETFLFTLSYFCNINGCKLSQLALQLSHLQPIPEDCDPSNIVTVPVSRPQHRDGGSRTVRKVAAAAEAGRAADPPRQSPAEELAHEYVKRARVKLQWESDLLAHAESALQSVCSHPSWTSVGTHSASVDDKAEQGERQQCDACKLERRVPNPAGDQK